MAVNPLLATWISYARISQYLDANRKALRSIFNGGSVVPDYTQVLRMVRRSVEWAYGQNPNDETLNVTGAYMFSLVDANAAANVIAGGICTPAFIQTNPVSQAITDGGNVTFSVVAGGTSPYTYQWQFNLSAITGATSSSYTINGVDSGDAGSYRCVVTNPCGQAVSATAVLTVNAAPAVFVIGWSLTDPYLNDSTPLTITNSQSVNFIAGGQLFYPGPLAPFANTYVMWRYSATEPDPLTWVNSELNQGNIPDFTIRTPFTIGGFKYVCCRNPIALDTTLSLSLNP